MTDRLASGNLQRMDKLYDIKEAAKMLHIHPETLRQRIRDGAVKALKPGRKLVIRESEIEAYKKRIEGDTENSEDAA